MFHVLPRKLLMLHNHLLKNSNRRARSSRRIHSSLFLLDERGARSNAVTIVIIFKVQI